MKCARVTTFTESIWNWPSRVTVVWRSRMPSGRVGRDVARPWAVSATRRASLRLIDSLRTPGTLAAGADSSGRAPAAACTAADAALAQLLTAAISDSVVSRMTP